MNAGPTAERVYESLKNAIMERAFRPGDRLDPAALSEHLNSSTTPVREALDRLLGEDLVETRPGSGFHLPVLDEPALKDMYAWSAELLVLAIRSWPRAATAAVKADLGATEATASLPRRAARLFSLVAERSINSEHARAVGRLTARLQSARTVEPLVLDGCDTEIDALEAAYRADDRRALNRGLVGYHRLRVRSAAAILRALYRAG